MKVKIPPEELAFMRRGVSVIVGSRDLNLRPSVMRAVGSDVSDDGSRVTVFLARSQARQVLQDIAANGWISVVFSELSSHRSLQLKASSAQARHATAAHRHRLAAYLVAMERELGAIRIPAKIIRAMLSHRVEEVVAVSFTPEHAFDQTPGPHAGTTLGGAA
jgi:hypothetical protein